MKYIPHWDVDEDYIVDISNSITIFQRIQATDKELVLASAAPDLLEALQWAMSKIGGYYTRTKSNGDYCDAVDRANAAISKALGEE